MNNHLLTRTYFNDLAPAWENKQTDNYKKIFKLLSRVGLAQSQNILDIGCGTGILFPILKTLTQDQGNVYALDFAECMVSEAFKNKNGIINILCADAQFLPFKDDFFDRVIAFHAFPHINDKTQAINEFWRVLKPGGKVAIVHLRGSDELNQFHSELNGVVANHILPAGNELGNEFEHNNFMVSRVTDNRDEYYVEAIKPDYYDLN